MFNLAVFSCFSIIGPYPLGPLGQVLLTIAKKKQKNNPYRKIDADELTVLLKELEEKLTRSGQELEEQINSHSFQEDRLKAVLLEIEECKKIIKRKFGGTNPLLSPFAMYCS